MVFITTFNLILIFLLRYLVKNNLFIKFLGFLSIFFQFLVILIFPFLDRTNSVFSFEVRIIIIFFVTLIPVVIPWIINFLSEKRKNALKVLENNLNSFTYTLLYETQEFFYKIPFYKNCFEK